MKIIENYLNNINISEFVEIAVKDIVFDQGVIKKCSENKCSGFNKNFMCPPNNGSFEDNKKEIAKFNKGFLIFIKDKYVTRYDVDECYESADRLHDILLSVENYAISVGYRKVMGLIAGHCRLCDPCGISLNLKSCIRPKEARPSMESVGIDVVKTCANVGKEIKFGYKGITWVGMILL